MHRSLYGHDYKPPSKIARNLLIGSVGVIVVTAFVWKTYDPQTLRLMSGVGPEAEKVRPTAEFQPVDPNKGARR